jgi:hypothetical protein
MFTTWTAIRESWLRIFENTKMIKFVITNIKIKAFQNIAIVVCLENIDSVIEDKNSIRTGVITTNIFKKLNVNYEKYNNESLMIHHRGSAVGNYMVPNVSVYFI